MIAIKKYKIKKRRRRRRRRGRKKRTDSALLAMASRPARGDNAGLEVEGREWGVVIVFKMSQPLY